MPEKPRIPLVDFSGGWNSVDKATRLPLNEFPTLRDVRYSRRGLEKRRGYVKHCSAQAKAGAPMLAFFLHYAASGTVTAVCVVSDGVYEWTGAAWVQRYASAGTVSGPPLAAQYGDYLYILLGPSTATEKLLRFEPGASNTIEVGFAAPSATPTATAGAGAGVNLTGDYQYRFTYVREQGGVMIWESNPSPASSTASPVAQPVQVGNLPVAGAPAACTHYYIYRIKLGYLSEFKYIGKCVKHPAGGTFDDPTADGSEGVMCPGLGYTGTYSHGPPPDDPTSICVHGGYLLLGKGRRLYVSNERRPWSFKSDHYIDCGELGDLLVGIARWQGTAYAVCQKAIVALLANPGGSIPWQPYAFEAEAEAMSAKALAQSGSAIYWVGRHGVMEWAGGDPKPISTRIDNYFADADPAKLDDAAMVLCGDQLWLAINDPDGGNAYNDTLIVADLRVRTQQTEDEHPQPAWLHDSKPADVNCFCVGHAKALTAYDSHLFAGTANAQSYALRLDTGKSDDGANIVTLIKKTLILGGVHQEAEIKRLWPEIYPTGTASDVLSVQVTVDGVASGYKTVDLSGTTYDRPADTQLEFVERGRIFEIELKHDNKNETVRPVFQGFELQYELEEVRP